MAFEPKKVSFLKGKEDYIIWQRLLRTLLGLGNSLRDTPISIKEVHEDGNYEYFYKRLENIDEEWGDW